MSSRTRHTGGPASPIELRDADSRALPADYEDKNHPHFPNDYEAQAHQPRSFLGKKKLWLFSGYILLLVALAVAGVILGVKMKHEATENPKTPPVNETIVPSLAWATVIETIIHSSTNRPLIINAPTPVTVTRSDILSIIPSPQTTKEEPTAEVPATPTPELSPPAAAPSDWPNGASGCMYFGHFSSESICKEHCKPEAGKQKSCDMMRAWRCVICAA
ncbi:hypothetical protein BS50DRAFT_644472 [Corynespora cassiicola Philippines]|uniref:Uncharacterized protein n=1 Tax=Corynespora cassiicola Philippines TaxID=1448308 RepID=A0A2T2PDH2_CORCC|nr:hypothetical protein BS50DRAFT_644472 [Corynespora cassiicola Philippines]